MKLADWARKEGLSYRTAWRLFRTGKLPIPSERLVTGTILVHELPVATNNVALYARVSSGDQRQDLDRQLQRLRDYSASQGFNIIDEVFEIGSSLNGHRKKLLKILSNPAVSTIVVEHRDRLARFGSEYIEATLAASNRKLVVVNATEMKNDLVQDMIDVLTSFCARLYGKRAARNRAQKALEAAQS